MARIVIADDHELVRSGIIASLHDYPHLNVCGVAGNGQEAIDRVLELEPDLIILDLSMPVLNGFQVAMKIRQLAPTVKILVLSIHEAPLVGQVAFLMGAHAYLAKSATPRELITTVNTVLAGTTGTLPVEVRSSPVSPAADARKMGN